MDTFEKLLLENKCAVERFVRFKVSSAFDADDIIQDTYMAAYNSFDMLENKDVFKAWIIGIARNKICDYYRKKARLMEIPLEKSLRHHLIMAYTA